MADLNNGREKTCGGRRSVARCGAVALAAFAAAALAGSLAAAKPYKAHVSPHTHWDREWGFTEEQHYFNLIKIMDNLIAIMESDPEYKYFTLDGQTSMPEDYLKFKPEMRDRLVKLVKDGRIQAGPFYVQLDEFLASGEAQVRNLLYGVRMANELGGVSTVGYSSDNFGHNGQLPQLLRGFGLDAFVFTRGVNERHEVYKGLFRWLAIDGKSWVYASPQPGGYGNFNWAAPVEALAMTEASGAYLKTAPNSVKRTLLFNAGSDAEEPVFELPQVIKMLNKKFPSADLVFSNFRRYVDAIAGQNPKLKSFAGDLRGDRLLACVTSRIPLKQANFKSYNTIEKYAEPASALSWLVTGREYPDYFIEEAWKRQLLSLPHDSVTGTSFDEVTDPIQLRFQTSARIAEQTAIRGFKTLIEAIHVEDKGSVMRRPLYAFNTLPWTRDGAAEGFYPIDDDAEAKIRAGGFDDVRVETEDGTVAPSHFFGFTGDRKLLFYAEGIPGMGYKTYYLVPVKRGRAASRRAGGSTANGLTQVEGEPRFENAFYKAAFNEDGSLDLTLKATGRTMRGLNRFEDHRSPGDTWNYNHSGDGPVQDTSGVAAKFDIVENNPVRTAVKVDLSDWEIDSNKSGVGKVRAGLVSYVHFYLEDARIDFYTEFDNKAVDHRLRAVFPTGARTQTVWADSQFGVVERDAEKPNPMEDPGNPEPAYPHLRFADAADEGGGLAVFNQGQPEYQARKNAAGEIDLMLTLLRATGAMGEDARPSIVKNPYETKDDDWSSQQPGTSRFYYAVQAHAGDWRESKINRAAAEYAARLWPESLTLDDAPKWQRGPNGTPRYYRYPSGHLDPAAGFLDIDNSNIEWSALKKAEDGDSIVIRVYNANAAEETGVVSFAFGTEARAVMLDETGDDPRVKFQSALTAGGEGVRITATLDPYQIATFKIPVQPPKERPWFYTRY